MSFIRDVGFNNDNTVDAFGRARTSEAAALAGASFIYDMRPLRWNTSTSGGGTVAKTANESSVTLSVGTVNADTAIFQSKKYIHYQPGSSQLVQMTGILGAAKANVQSEIGYNDAKDGVFFRQANGASVVVRSNTSGSVVDTVVAQASWNVDHMDGTGPSGLTIDFSKSQIFVIDFQWLATGRVRFGFNNNGITYYCHVFMFSNSLTSPYSNRGNLPLRYRITNTGTAGSGTTVKAICCSVHSEGLQINIEGLPFTANNGTSLITVTTRRPILSIQVAATFASQTNREQVIMDLLEFAIISGTLFWEVVLNGTLGGGGTSFSAVDATNSGVNKDVGSTTITGGTVLASGYVSGNTDTSRGIRDFLGLSELNTLGNSLDGTTGDILSIVGTAITGSLSASAVMNWHEVR